jgi:hypothetical protein
MWYLTVSTKVELGNKDHSACVFFKFSNSLKKKVLCRPEYQVSQPCECRNLFSMYALLSQKLVEESHLKISLKEKKEILKLFFLENGKLRTYLKLKCNFGFENYLIFYQILIKENLSPNLESATIN